jgi:asparagine synthase (glutamine-hydrolysing)
MCGITGIVALHDRAIPYLNSIDAAVATLSRRGPDGNGVYKHGRVALGHTRLSIIDTSHASDQPFIDPSGRYVLVFNGEIFNYQVLRKKLIDEGINLSTQGDTEVLLQGFVHWGDAVFAQLNGFFAFALYDNQAQVLTLARDRMGVKPLLIYQDADRLVFGSELKALLAADIPRQINHTALYSYLQLNYVPPNQAILQNTYKLSAGTVLQIDLKSGAQTARTFYKIPTYTPQHATTLNYEQAQKQLLELMDDAVRLRLVADVPVGAFLSGGIDSSIITALAARHTDKLHTFSVGFRDESFFDETRYARLVAQRYQTEHTEFLLSNADLFSHFYEALDYIDEPFADSSALAVYILSKQVGKKIKVALSGDGADELFAGYNKHRAEYEMRRQNRVVRYLLAQSAPVWACLPQSRHSNWGNKLRQINRFAQAASLSAEQRYWQWASIQHGKAAAALLIQQPDTNDFLGKQQFFMQEIMHNDNLNSVLYADMHLVLQGDMLTKVDSMSMANSLEVRTPFLDYRIVNFAFQMPINYKIDRNFKKKIVQDCFKNSLPIELYNRPKHGFEVPLLKWMRGELKSLIINDLLSESFVKQQNIFNYSAIKKLLDDLFSNNPGDAAAKIWALLVFQNTWRKNLA